MFRTILLASPLALGITGAAQAQGGPRMVGGGPDAQVVYDEPSENVVGGGYGTIVGEANSRTVVYGGPTTAQASNGLIGEITGEAGNRTIVYHQAAPAAARALAAARSARQGG